MSREDSVQSQQQTHRLKRWFAVMMVATVPPIGGILLNGTFVVEALLLGMVIFAVGIAGFAYETTEVY